MTLLNRISSGLVLEDKFESPNLNSMWQISPSDSQRFSLTERAGYLRLKHGDPDLFCLMTAPNFDFVFEVDTDYSPIRASDTGGIVAYRDKDTRIELLEYYDPQLGTARGYDRLRMIRQADLFSGYGSDDGGMTWELIGTSYLAAPKIGMVLHGIQEAQSDTLDISGMRIYRSTELQVGNLREGLIVKLLTPAGTMVKQATCEKDKDYVKLDVTNLSFPYAGRVQVTDSTGLVLGETADLTDIWGGDVYTYGVHLDLEVDGVMMREDREYQLGNMQEGLIEKKMYVINNHDIPLPRISVAISAFSKHYGWEWADIALDVIGQPGTYQDSLYLGNINPQERIPIWLKITRRATGNMTSMNDYKFLIAFESG